MEQHRDAIDERKSVLFLGDKGSGKSSLVCRLQGEDVMDVKEGLSPSYAYVDVVDEHEDLLGRLNMWEMPPGREFLPFWKYVF